MKFAKRVVIPLTLTDDFTYDLRVLRDFDFLNATEVHFINVFTTITYVFTLGDVPVIYPIEKDKKVIEESVNAMLARISKEVLPKGFTGKCINKCLFSDSPKEAAVDYIQEAKADLVIVPTRRKHGFFESSFAQYVNKHTDANMILIKVNEKDFV